MRWRFRGRDRRDVLEQGEYVHSALESQRIERVARDAGQSVGTRAAGAERKSDVGRAERIISFNPRRKDIEDGA